ncbi:hypothetical protein KAR91_83745 [Candidatus Pacearchaeota archaeon]|nr:hypothetical protein [Candidatus Pacearchaeota archaeon]
MRRVKDTVSGLYLMEMHKHGEMRPDLLLVEEGSLLDAAEGLTIYTSKWSNPDIVGFEDDLAFERESIGLGEFNLISVGVAEEVPAQIDSGMSVMDILRRRRAQRERGEI